MVQFQHKPNTYKHISYCHNFFQNSFSQKNTKRKRLRGKCKYWQKSVKTEQLVKIDFFENLTFLRSQKSRTRKGCVHSPGLHTKNFRSFRFFCDFRRIKRWTAESVSCAEIRIYSINFSLETLLGSKKTQNKRYSGVATEIDNTQVQRKQKETTENGLKTEKKRAVSRKRFSLTPFI